jgi:hypothetical protein
MKQIIKILGYQMAIDIIVFIVLILMLVKLILLK